MKVKKRKAAPKALYVLFDKDGILCAVQETPFEAADEAVGPRFRPRSIIRAYTLVPKHYLKVEGG